MGGHHHNHLTTALLLTACFAVVELLGGLYAGSLALLADAGHMFSDVIALGIAAIAAKIAQRPAHARMTFGYGRVKILAAQLNGLGLWVLSAWIAWEALGRMSAPPQVNGAVVLIVASIGLLINLIVLKWLHGGHDINTKAAYWHVLGDAVGSVAALIAGVIILYTGWMLIDPLLSFLVAVLLAWGGWRLFDETTAQLMAAVPENIDIQHVRDDLMLNPQVLDVHHVHIWRLPNDELAISAHIKCKNIQDWPHILFDLQARLSRANIDHITLQAELNDCVSHSLSCHGL